MKIANIQLSESKTIIEIFLNETKNLRILNINIDSYLRSFQFQEFETEKSFDIVQILVGGRTEEKSVNLATLSGKQELSNKLFVSASNFMIIKFSTDSSVERKGFRASWKTEPQTCGGILRATPQGQVLTSPGYPQNYPGGLECLYILQAQPGRIMSLEVCVTTKEITE